MLLNCRVKNQKAFTLIELLVVIAILAVLAVAVTLILNPAELIRQGRDSTRLSDLATINRALGLYQTDQIAKWMGTSTIVYTSLPDTTSTCASYGLPSLPSGWEYNCVQESSSTRVDGTGWIPVDFTSMSFSSPLSRLPLDPVNEATSSKYYTYVSGGSWELSAVMEASSNKLGGDNDRVSNDGGDSYSFYEVGDDLDLSPINDDGLVGYWQFDEGTGSTTADLSGNGNSGAITGASWSTSCIYGNCLSFDGNGDYVDCNDVISSGEATVTFWFKSTDTSQHNGIIDFSSNGNRGHFDFNSNGSGNPLLYLASSNYRYFSSSFQNYLDGSWHFLVLYIKGVQQDDILDATLEVDLDNISPGGTLHSEPPVTWDDLRISQGYGSAYFNGLIDDVRIYNRALSAAEIEAMYNSY